MLRGKNTNISAEAHLIQVNLFNEMEYFVTQMFKREECQNTDLEFLDYYIFVLLLSNRILLLDPYFSGQLGNRMPLVASECEVGLKLCHSLRGKPLNCQGDYFYCLCCKSVASIRDVFINSYALYFIGHYGGDSPLVYGGEDI